KVLIKGDIAGNASNPAQITAWGQKTASGATDVAIGSLRVLGNVQFALIRAGDTEFGKNADAQIGSVFVGGNWTASSIAAGVDPTNGSFGDADDAKLSGDPVMSRDRAGVSSRIGSVTIVGQATGTDGGTDYYGIVAENVGAVTVAGARLTLAAGNGNDDL